MGSVEEDRLAHSTIRSWEQLLHDPCHLRRDRPSCTPVRHIRRGAVVTFLSLSPLEWLLILAITTIVVGIGRLPERRAQPGDRDQDDNIPR